MLIIEDLGDYLELNGVGVLGENMFLGIEREEPPSQVIVRGTGGYILPSQTKETKPTFQIFVRDVNYEVGYEKIWGIFNLINNNPIVESNGRKMIIKPMQPPFPLGENERNQSLFVFNIYIITSIE